MDVSNSSPNNDDPQAAACESSLLGEELNKDPSLHPSKSWGSWYSSMLFLDLILALFFLANYGIFIRAPTEAHNMAKYALG